MGGSCCSKPNTADNGIADSSGKTSAQLNDIQALMAAETIRRQQIVIHRQQEMFPTFAAVVERCEFIDRSVIWGSRNQTFVFGTHVQMWENVVRCHFILVEKEARERILLKRVLADPYEDYAAMARNAVVTKSDSQQQQRQKDRSLPPSAGRGDHLLSSLNSQPQQFVRSYPIRTPTPALSHHYEQQQPQPPLQSSSSIASKMRLVSPSPDAKDSTEITKMVENSTAPQLTVTDLHHILLEMKTLLTVREAPTTTTTTVKTTAPSTTAPSSVENVPPGIGKNEAGVTREAQTEELLSTSSIEPPHQVPNRRGEYYNTSNAVLSSGGHSPSVEPPVLLPQYRAHHHDNGLNQSLPSLMTTTTNHTNTNTNNQSQYEIVENGGSDFERRYSEQQYGHIHSESMSSINQNSELYNTAVTFRKPNEKDSRWGVYQVERRLRSLSLLADDT